MNVAQNPGVAHLRVVPDRRVRAREQRRERMLQAAGRLIDRDGLAGVTMQGLADELECAVGTIYLYFPSKAALVAALQGEAIETLRASYDAASHSWDDALAGEGLGVGLETLVRLVAFGAHWVSAGVVYADEFHLQRELLASRVSFEAQGEAVHTLGVLDALLANPSRLLEAAAKAGTISRGEAPERALVWVAALNGVLQLDELQTLDRHRFRGAHLARGFTRDLLVGWGAPRADVEVAESTVEMLAALGPLAPPPDEGRRR